MKATSFANMFVAQLQLARSEAIKRNHRVVACRSAGGVNCASAGGWEQGWIVFDDANNNGLRDDGELLLQRVDPLPAGWRISGNQNVSRYISFEPSGETRLASGAFQAGTITVCREQSTASEARQIIINAVGRPRIQKSTVASCA
ncbi:GspH/FimT family protein [Ramlibacter sp.]|uniref:GspH/FimT family protein n=1 Tax=Ramlibacter sp. TaxID=1917967 RepID=UPI0025FCCA95|nr:GspH/FimT family protein [Ramlibacter sp.]